MRKFFLLTLSLLLCGSIGFAQSGSGNSSGSQQSSGSGQASAADKHFAMTAAQGGLAEVQMGQMAQQNGQSEQVKQLGQTLVQDHQQANDQLKQIVTQEGMTPPTSPDAKDQAEMKKLQGMSGAQFDKAFAAYEVKDHEKDIKEFQKEANSGKDPQLKQFAQQTLPILQKHLQMAQQAQQAGGSGKSSGQ